jgi:hypothetical protein
MNAPTVQRYVPLLCWIVVAATCLCIPLKILSYGFVPGGDARRHVAKALTDKEYSQILVLRPEYKMDHSPGWGWILQRLHRAAGWGEDGLMSFSVAGLMLCVLICATPWLRRPEAWLAALLAQLVAIPGLMVRLDQGRPYLLSEALLVCILFAWSKDRTRCPSWQKVVLTFAGFALSVWTHGAWYLWVVAPAGFFMAGAWRQAGWLSGCWVAGTIAGALLTGQPAAFLYEGVFMAARVFREHAPAWMLVGEFQPSEGEFCTLAVLALAYIWRRRQKQEGNDLLGHPVFWVIAICWTLGFKADRFWADWGMPAAMVWLALRLEEGMVARWPADSGRRLLLCGLIAAPLYLDATSDSGMRFSNPRQESFVDGGDPALQGWMPEGDGIFYNADMGFFYNTFYRNPRANWRYILGFEPALMPDEDLKILRGIQRARYDWRAYEPWINKMRPQDRLEIPASAQPAIPELEWRLAANGIWIGRKPQGK